MAHHLDHTLMGFLLIAFFSDGLSEMIKTQDTVAMVGEEACFTCQLTQSKNVLQVTWQKIIPGGTEDVATSNKRFGTKINPPFQEKFKFKDTGLQNSAIVIMNVTKADECCFRCLFNAYPEGAIYTKTCLTVNEQPEPILHITKPNGTEQMVVSCSAVSRPAPSVTLQVPRHEGPSNYTTVHAANANGTITVNSTVSLERFCSNGTQVQVRCVVRLYSGVEVSRVLYSDKQACDVFEKSEAEDQSVFIILVIFVVAVIGVGVLITGLILQQKGTRWCNDSENKQTLQTENQETKVNLLPDCTPVKTILKHITDRSYNDPEINVPTPNQIKPDPLKKHVNRNLFDRSNSDPQMKQTPQTTNQETTVTLLPDCTPVKTKPVNHISDRSCNDPEIKVPTPNQIRHRTPLKK